MISNYMFVQSFSVITDTVGTRESVLINRLSLLGLFHTRDREEIGNRKESESYERSYLVKMDTAEAQIVEIVEGVDMNTIFILTMLTLVRR